MNNLKKTHWIVDPPNTLRVGDIIRRVITETHIITDSPDWKDVPISNLKAMGYTVYRKIKKPRGKPPSKHQGNFLDPID